MAMMKGPVALRALIRYTEDYLVCFVAESYPCLTLFIVVGVVLAATVFAFTF